MVKLTKEAPWQDRMRTMLRMPVTERPAAESSQRTDDDTGPAVPRVLDLTLRIGELLLAGGEGAEDVEAAMFAVTRSYGLTAASRRSRSPCCRSRTSRRWSTTR